MTISSILSSGIAQRYAHAFFELMDSQNALEVAQNDMLALQKTISASADFGAFIKSPVHSRDVQEKTIAAIATKAGFAPMTRNFLSLIAKNRRLFALSDMIEAFQARLAVHRGEVSAEATTAAPLSKEQERRLRQEIETVVGKAVNLETRVDPSLLGGMIVKVGSQMIDSSLKTKLARLQSVMKEA